MELIERVTIDGPRVTFAPARELRPFVPDDLRFEYEPSVDLGSLPRQVVELPFLWNVVPIVWAIGAHANVDVLDPRVAASFQAVRAELRLMYPSLAWSGDVTARQQSAPPAAERATHKNAALFTGGVDSTSTALSHAGPDLLLVSIWGADIRLGDERTWRNIETRNRRFAARHAGSLAVVRSNFRSLNYPRLNRLSPDIRLWLSHVQISMALAAACAPVLHHAGVETLHIASSVPPQSIDSVTYFAGLPRLDNLISLGRAQVHHDEAHLSRQQKVQRIVDYVAANDSPPPFLQVCIHHIPAGGGNCQRCEKCLRTMASVKAAGADPRLFGFPDFNEGHLATIRRAFDTGEIRFTQAEAEFWTDLQELLPAHADGPFWDWLRSFDFVRYGHDHPPVRRRGWAQTSVILARAPRVLSAARRARQSFRGLNPRI
jgi:hypothetical protein